MTIPADALERPFEDAEVAPETAADFLALTTRRARSHDPTFPARGA